MFLECTVFNVTNTCKEWSKKSHEKFKNLYSCVIKNGIPAHRRYQFIKQSMVLKWNEIIFYFLCFMWQHLMGFIFRVQCCVFQPVNKCFPHCILVKIILCGFLHLFYHNGEKNKKRKKYRNKIKCRLTHNGWWTLGENILPPFACSFLLFQLFAWKTLKKHISTSVWSVQQPNAGQNIHKQPFTDLIWPKSLIPNDREQDGC